METEEIFRRRKYFKHIFIKNILKVLTGFMNGIDSYGFSLNFSVSLIR